jgi:exopolysaccharide biosynthesis protein
LGRKRPEKLISLPNMKKAIAIFFISLYTMMLLVSYVPYMVYYGQKYFQNEAGVALNSDKASKALIGDACYINALVKRSVDADHNNTKTTPPPPINISQSIYLMADNSFNQYLSISTPFQFKTYMISIKETFLDVQIPPPKA